MKHKIEKATLDVELVQDLCFLGISLNSRSSFLYHTETGVFVNHAKVGPGQLK
jgi:hypothetical protein